MSGEKENGGRLKGRLPAFVAPADAEMWLAVRKLGTELFGPHMGWRAAKGLWKRWGLLKNVD